jgi:hypothetical protein
LYALGKANTTKLFVVLAVDEPVEHAYVNIEFVSENNPHRVIDVVWTWSELLLNAVLST